MLELFKLFGTIGINNSGAISAINDTTKQAESSSSRMISAFKKVGKVLLTVFAVDKIKDFGVNIVQTAADVQAENAQFEASFKDLKDEATDMFKSVGEETGVFATRLRVTGTKAFSQFKGAGMDANDALGKTKTFLNLASDAAAYYDISLEDAETRIRSFLRGNVEAGDAIGLFTSESQRNQYAVEMYGKKWIKLSEAQKQNLMLNVAKDIYDQSGATGQAARESDGLANVVGNLKEVWRQFLAVVGKPVLKAVTPILQNITNKVKELQTKWETMQKTIENSKALQNFKTLIQGIIDKVKALGEWLFGAEQGIKDVSLAIGALIIVWAGFKVGKALQSLVTGFQKARIQLALYNMEMGSTNLLTNLWRSAQQKLNLTFLSSPITWIVVAIAALVAIFVVAYNKSETFRKAVDELWAVIKEHLIKAFEEIKPVMEEVITALKELWDVIWSVLGPVIKWLVDLIKQYMPYIKAVISATLTWIITGVKNCITIVTTVIKNLLVVVKTIINNIKIAIQTWINVIKNIIKVFTSVLKGDWKGAWEAVKNIGSSILNGIKKTFSNTFSGIKSIVKNSLSGIKSVFSNTWNGIKTATSKIWNGIYNSVTKPVKKAMDKVKKYIDKIKGFFTGFTAKMKLPHFKIKNASLNPKNWIKNGVPKLSVEWYKDGGIMTQPTVFDYNPMTNTAKVGGEAGAEAIAPIDTLMKYVQAAVRAENGNLEAINQRIYDILANFLPTIAEGMNVQLYLDGDTLVARLLPKIDKKLGASYDRKVRYS